MVEAFQGRARGERGIDAQLRPRSCAPDPAAAAPSGNASCAADSPCGVCGGSGAAAAGPLSSQPRVGWPEGGPRGGARDAESPLSAAAVSSEQPLSWGRPGGQRQADEVPLLTRVLYDWMGWFGPSPGPVAPSSRSEKVAAWRRKSAMSPAPPARPLRDDVTRDEVARHNRKDDAWVIVNGAVYDVTEYLGYHPGGASILARCAGKDASAAFMRQHPWVNVRAMLARCRVGMLAADAIQARARAEAEARRSSDAAAAAAAAVALADAHGLPVCAAPAAVAGAHGVQGRTGSPALPAPAAPPCSEVLRGCDGSGSTESRVSEPDCSIRTSREARARWSEAGLSDARRDTSSGGTELLEGPHGGTRCGARVFAADAGATEHAAGACNAGAGARLRPSPHVARVA